LKILFEDEIDLRIMEEAVKEVRLGNRELK